MEQKEPSKMEQAEQSLKEILENIKPFLPPKQVIETPAPHRWTVPDRATRQCAPKRLCAKTL